MDSTESTPSPSFSDLAADSGAKKMMSVAEMMRKIQEEPLTSGDEEEDDAEDNDGKIIKDNDGKILDLAKVVPGAASAGGGLTTHSQVKSIEQLKNVQLYEKSSMDVLAWEPPNGKKSIVAIIFIRITPSTKDHNDGLAQLITCIIGIYLLNKWGAAHGTSYVIHPQIIISRTKRQDPDKSKGL